MQLLLFSPILFTAVGFILAIVGIFAGNTPGFMEDYQIMVLNTSVLGRNYVPQLQLAASSKRSQAYADIPDTNCTHDDYDDDDDDNDNDDDSYGTTRTNMKRQITLAAAEGQLAGLTYAEAAIRMAGMLGISQFYSLHVLSACEGGYAPNASTLHSWRNVTNCTTPLGLRQLDLWARIDGQLKANFASGGSTNNDNSDNSDGDNGLTALGASSSLRSALGRIPTIGMSVAVFYLVGGAAAGLGLAVALAAPVLLRLASTRKYARETLLAGLGSTSGAALALLVAGLVAVVAGGAAVDSINRLGKETIGMAASRGKPFADLTWAATAFNGLAAVLWVYIMRDEARKEAAAKKAKEAAAAAASAEKKV